MRHVASNTREPVGRVPSNVLWARERIATAARRSGRRPEDVTLIAVTKEVGVGSIRAAIAAGVADLAESRVQEASPKIHELGRAARWHLVGHLQRNKAARAVELFDVIHAVDGRGILRELSKRASHPREVLIQVNVAAEPQKHGVAPEDVFELAAWAAELPALRIVGLMTIAPLVENPETVRAVFRRLRELRDELNARVAFRAPLRHLSMGMTDDFEVAIEEGATMVRIGRGIFGERSQLV